MLFVENEDTEAFKADRNKLFVSDEKQIDNYTISFDNCFTCTCQLCVPTIVVVSLKIFLVWLLFFVGLCSQNSY